jgi:hypothetical protein
MLEKKDKDFDYMVAPIALLYRLWNF